MMDFRYDSVVVHTCRWSPHDQPVCAHNITQIKRNPTNARGFFNDELTKQTLVCIDGGNTHAQGGE